MSVGCLKLGYAHYLFWAAMCQRHIADARRLANAKASATKNWFFLRIKTRVNKIASLPVRLIFVLLLLMNSL